jgi:hypothetical protein
MTSEQQYRKCVPPCTRYLTGGDTHDLCVACLGVQHAQSALEGADCEHCERFPIRTLRSRRSLFEESGSVRAPRGSGPASVEAERRRLSWGSQMDLSAGSETGAALSQPLPASSSASVPGVEARFAVSSPRAEAPMLQLSSSEELDVVSVETGDIEDSSSHSPEHEELMEVLTRAVSKLSIEWPAVRQECVSKSKLDERFLPSRAQPPRRCLPFLPDLHTEVSRSWKRPASYRVFSPQTSTYSNISGAKFYGYGAMPKAEETLASHLSAESSSSLKAPALPTKPLRNTSALVGKAYSAAGQASACLHTMSILQAYQADLLKDMSESEEVSSDMVHELRQAADLSLRATKESAKMMGRTMAALVAAERHLWLNLSDMKDKEKAFLLDAPLSPSGLFGDAVDVVIEKFQEEKKQAAAFQRFLPLKVSISGSAGRGQTKPSTSSSHRVQQKQSVASRGPPSKQWQQTRHSQAKPSSGKTDLRTVIVARKASSKKKS